MVLPFPKPSAFRFRRRLNEDCSLNAGGELVVVYYLEKRKVGDQNNPPLPFAGTNPPCKWTHPPFVVFPRTLVWQNHRPCAFLARKYRPCTFWPTRPPSIVSWSHRPFVVWGRSDPGDRLVRNGPPWAAGARKRPWISCFSDGCGSSLAVAACRHGRSFC